jgi:hypothetical protein
MDLSWVANPSPPPPPPPPTPPSSSSAYPSPPLGDFTATRYATRSQVLDSPLFDSLATGFPLHVAKPQTLSHKPLNFLTLFFTYKNIAIIISSSR